MKWLLWLLKGKPMVHYTGYNCGCCGRRCDKEFDIPEYRLDWFDTWGLCPDGEGCRKIDKEREYQSKLHDAYNRAKADIIKAKADYPY